MSSRNSLRLPGGRRARLRRGLRFTREGRIFVLVTLGIGAAAVNTGNNLMYLVLGLMLSLIVLSGVLSDLVLWSVRVRRSLPARAFAQSPCVIEIALANDKRWLPTYSVEIEDRVEGEPTDRRCYFLKVGARGEEVAAYRRTPMRRGVLRFSGVRLSTRFPFGLFEKWRMLEAPAELIVYPARIPVAQDDPSAGANADDVASRQAGHGTEVSGAREYRDGDEARSIHWQRTASLGRLVVRERERETGARTTIVLDNARPDRTLAGRSDAEHGAGWDAAFERAVSRAASLAERAHRRGAAVEIVARTSASPLVLPGLPLDPVFRFLALVAPVPASDAPPLPAPSGACVRVVPAVTAEESAVREAS